MVQILPVRLTEWSMTPTTADEHNKLELEEVRRKYFEAGEEIKALIEKRIVRDKALFYLQFNSSMVNFAVI